MVTARLPAGRRVVALRDVLGRNPKGNDMTSVDKKPAPAQRRQHHDPRTIRLVLAAGSSFAALIASILGVVGVWSLGDRTILYALITLCVIAALTMFTATYMAGRR